MKIIIIALLIYCSLGLTQGVQGHTIPLRSNNIQSVDSSLSKLLNARVAKFKAIPVESGTDNYYVKLMLALYDGANDMVKFQIRNGPSNSLAQQSALFQRFHSQMSNRFVGFLSVKSKETTVDARFKLTVDAALQHFSRFNYQPNIKAGKLLAAVLIEFYENMDQISIAFVSMGKSEQLKQLAWDSIKKQNKLVELLKQR
ncbi:hypothetical protein CKK33_18195 [Mucilaginibacter sp. MD40]|uniref:hypothetical protein n=1 Tax=Mucilaginibacter sp. MD40 TaxID=2029590 RepID=UPI000BAC79BD|nr:hypothetical protein [Mucilaginibacter sp. MD40]PAW95328.1 hypothetical protein CKK33_18195 [Mucilaginibacter sp. MD40]